MELNHDLMIAIFGNDPDDNRPRTQEQRQKQVNEPAVGECADVFIKSEFGDQLIVSGDVVAVDAETFTIDCRTPDRRIRRTTYQRTTHFMRVAEVVNLTYTSGTTPPTVPVYLTEWELRGTDESGE